MNDSLLEELERDNREESDAPYQPLLGVTVEEEDPLWDELKEPESHESSRRSTTTTSGSHTNNTKTSLPQIRKHFPSTNLYHRTGGGNVPDAHGKIRNIDAFYIGLYNYYQHKGWNSIIVAGIVSLASLAFTILLSTFLLGCVDWSKLSSCNNSYEQGESLVHGCNQPLGNFIACHGNWGLYKASIFFYFFLFASFWVWSAIGFCSTTIKDSREMHMFYRNELQINTRELQTMKWDDVVQKVVELNEGKPRRDKINVEPSMLNAHAIASRVMRKENYLIAFMNMNVFNLSLGDTLPHIFGERASRVFFARNMEWNLHFCVLDHMFDSNFEIRRDFVSDLEGLQKRFVFAGIVNFFMTPFVLLFMIIHFFLKYSQEWHTRRNYLGPRQWSPLALWRFREFNELPHVFDKRIAASYPIAQKYQSMFPATVISEFARGISFVSGSLMAVLLFLSLVEEAILLEVHLYDRQLLWYLTVLTAVFAMARSFVPATDVAVSNAAESNPEEVMMQLSGCTHYFPLHWKGKCGSFDVRDELFTMFQYKVQLFFQECLSVLITPYLLIFSLPKSAPAIIRFVENHSVNDPALGAVCRYSLFDFKRYGNKAFGCDEGSDAVAASMNGKMEKSFLSFKENHPGWKGAGEGEALVDRLEAFKTHQESMVLEKSIASLASGKLNNVLGSMLHSTANVGAVPSAKSADGSLEETKADDEIQNTDHMRVSGLNSVLFGDSQHPLSLSQQLLQSQAIQSALGNTQHENNFYWLEKYYQANNEEQEQ